MPVFDFFQNIGKKNDKIVVKSKESSLKVYFISLKAIYKQLKAFFKKRVAQCLYVLVTLVVTGWSRGLETRGSGTSRYRMSENFGNPVTLVQKLQISLLMLSLIFQNVF